MRVRFWIDELLDMRSNAWQKKEKREQAKTLTDIRKGGATEDYLQGTFATTTVGLRPAYVKACRQKPQNVANPQDSVKVPCESDGLQVCKSIPSFNETFVTRIFEYYVEDSNLDSFVNDWQGGKPAETEAKHGITCLLEI